MNRIIGIYPNKQRANRVLEALEDMGFDKEAIRTFSRSRLEVDEVESEDSQEIMVIAYVNQDRQNQVETIFKNSGATQVNVWGEDWEPETTWSPIVYSNMFHR